MKLFQINKSQKSMYMNERAYSGEPINTIGFHMYFPHMMGEELKEAVNQVIQMDDIFRTIMIENNYEVKFYLQDKPVHLCQLEDRLTREEAEQKAKELEQLPFSGLFEGKLYKAIVWPIREGGALLAFCFHHIIIDGYGMYHTAQRILDILNKKEICYLFSYTGQELECDKKKTEENRTFWKKNMGSLHHNRAIFEETSEGFGRTSYPYSVPEDLILNIERFAAAHGLTMSSVFHGALMLYLAKATQCEDAVTIMPRLNREGRFLNATGCRTMVVPVRVHVEQTERFAALCKRTLESSRQAAEHKEYGIHRILEELRHENMIYGGVSEYTFNCYPWKLKSSIPFQIQVSVCGAMHNHLTVNLYLLNGRFEIIYDGKNGVYDKEKVDFFHESYLSILKKGVLENCRVEECRIVAEREQRKLLEQLAGNRTCPDRTSTIPSLFLEAVNRYQNAPALFYGKKKYSYWELERFANRIANGLIRKGVQKGELIMFMLPRDERLLPVIIGILKAGAAFVPIDPQYPKSRIDYILENSGAAFLITDASVKNARNNFYIDVNELTACDEEQVPEIFIQQEDMAYCIYTSGTTGKPKGVMLSHRGIANIIRADNNPFNRDICQRGKGIVAIGSVCFDISIFEIFVPLLNGMFVELAPQEDLSDPQAIAGLLNAHGANLMHCTPSRLAAYLNDSKFSDALKNVEAILAAGEVLPGTLVDRLYREYNIRIYNGYGPTETTIGATITEAGDNKTIGRPIANVGILIVDRQNQLLPFGATGELSVYGEGVGMGYRRMEDLTKERFCRIQGHRVYKTGDLGFYRRDGRICYCGRNDQQIKLRGLRIELSEIENCMLAYPSVGMSSAFVKNIGGREHLIGFYSPKSGVKVNESGLKKFLKEHLTLYMVPDIIKQVDVIPQTPGGKTDYAALKEIPIEYIGVYKKPETSLQKAICDAFATVLEQREVGLNDNFFEIGGTSLDVMGAILEIGLRTDGNEIQYGDFYKYPTPELLAAFLNREEEEENQRDRFKLQGLDYTGIDKVLNRKHNDKIKTHPLGNVLLTGVTGYLGIHLLVELLKNRMASKIFCLVRAKKKVSAPKRLRGALFYYSNYDYEEEIRELVTVVEGDIEQESFFAEEFSQKVDTVIHSAANVAHFAYGDTLDKTNVQGVKNLLGFCKKQSAVFVQISTISVGGVYKKGKKPLVLTEQDLYVGQEIHNQYVLSKYMAESEILKMAAESNVSVKIMRVGNLQGRLVDGEFQMNIKKNAFTRRLASYVRLGKVPRSLYESRVNFSPVDEVARRILQLASTDETYSVFHVFPPKEVSYRTLFRSVNKLGYPVEVMEDKEFEKLLERLEEIKEGKEMIEGILMERPNISYQDTEIKNELTNGILIELGSSWGEITVEYLDNYFNVLNGMALFDK